MRTALCIFCAVGALFFGGCSRDSASPRQSLPASPEMNALVRAIHGDLLALRSKHSWLSEYKETDLGETEGRASISYVYDPPVAPGTPSPQASDQIAISYVPLNYSFKGAKVFENSNQF